MLKVHAGVFEDLQGLGIKRKTLSALRLASLLCASPNSDNSNNARYVNSDGNVNNNNVNNTNGVRPRLLLR